MKSRHFKQTSPSVEVEQLRQKAKAIRAKQNEIAERVWFINITLDTDNIDSASRQQLESERTELLRQEEKEKYPDQFARILHQIKTLELKNVGHTSIGNGPFDL